ncbi:MAG: HEAT repeat domain-containing protein [Planctomycetota bacterium]
MRCPRIASIVPCLLLLLAPLLAALPPLDDGLVKDFRREFKKLEGSANRVEAVLALEYENVPGVVTALLPVLEDDDSDVARAAQRVLAALTAPEALAALTAALESETKTEVRLALLRVFEVTGRDEAGPTALDALGDRAWQVRRQAALTLTACDPEAARTALLPLLDDKETAVRCAAYGRLGLLRERTVLEPAWRDLEHSVWQVRAAAIGALALVRSKDSIGRLIDRLELEEGRLRQDIGTALESITGRALGERVDAWRRFWDTYRDRFEIPTDAELEALRAKQAERAALYQPAPDGATYHGISTPSKSILFVIDVSGSMEQEVVEKERYKDGDYPSMMRLDIVKTELARTIETLDSNVQFNIAAFATKVEPWKRRLVSANSLTKAAASTWLSRLKPIGGASKEDLASVGLGGSANLEAGKTNTYAALLWALGLDPEEKKSNDDYEVEIDTVFFLSDGQPSHGRYIETDEVLRELRQLNELRGVVFHTFGIGDFEKDFLERMALENGGTFVDLGK